MEVNKEQFLEWRSHPVTQAVFASLLSQIEEQKERWLEGAFMPEVDGLRVKNSLEEAGVLGRVKGYQVVVEFEYKDLNNEFRTRDEQDPEHFGSSPEGQGGFSETLLGGDQE